MWDVKARVVVDSSSKGYLKNEGNLFQSRFTSALQILSHPRHFVSVQVQFLGPFGLDITIRIKIQAR